MGEARARERWSHTSSVLCLLANLHRDPRKHRPFAPTDFTPFRDRPATAVKDTATGFRVMKHLFVDHPKPRGGTQWTGP